jgi:uncharacterized protein
LIIYRPPTRQRQFLEKADFDMTQAQAINREPTMEEILASIRRIIEDNNAPKPFEAEDGVAASSQAENQADFVDPDVAGFEHEFAAADVFSKPVQDTIVAQETSRYQEAGRYEVKHETSTPLYVEPTIDAPSACISPAPALEVEPIRQPFHELRPIISDIAGRQVAKSFESLSVALQEERNTSVAQMTEEMVRPMLQDWLDNNLPTLVERLVREEIERVSRGAR